MLLERFGMPRPVFAPPGEGGSTSSNASSTPSSGSSSTPSTPSSGGSVSTEPKSPASSSPSATPNRAPSEGAPEAGAGDTPSSDGSFDFIRDIFGDGPPQDGATVAVEGATAPQTPASAQQQPPSAAKAAEAPPAAAQPQQQAAPSVAEQPASSGQQQPPQRPQYDPADPTSLALGLLEHQAAAIENLAQTTFKLDPKEIEALETDFTGNLPKLLAKVAVFNQQQFLTQLGNIIPQMLQRQQAQTQKHSANEARFYQAWPQIDKAKHGELVTQLGVRYRKMFPNATLDQMVAELGPLVLTAAGLPPTAMHRADAGQPQGSKPGNGVRSPSTPPAGFVPAAPGQVVQSQQIPENPFGYMGPQTD